MNDDNWQGLADAIVVQATRDYRAALLGLRKNPENIRKLRELEDFFRSGWFPVLCDLDGVRLMWMLKNEVRGKHK